MKSVTKLMTVALLAAGVLGGTYAAQAAQAAEKAGENDAMAVNSAAVSLVDAVNAATAQVPGKPAKAEFETDDANQQAVWEVEIVTADGKVMDVTVDAANGTVLKQTADQADTGEEDEGEHEGNGQPEKADK